MTDELRWQFDLAWALAELHLSALVDDDFSPQAPVAAGAGELDGAARRATGRGSPDWADAEPDPLPVPTIGWLTWHITSRTWGTPGGRRRSTI